MLPSSHKLLHLNDVLLVPKLKKNLFSISKLTYDNECMLEFNNDGFLKGSKQEENSQGTYEWGLVCIRKWSF